MCPEVGAECIQEEGTTRCNCTKGFEKVNGACKLKDFCGNGGTSSCGENGKCQNIVGGFECICDPMYYSKNNTCVSAIITIPTTTQTTIPTTIPTTPLPLDKCDPETTIRVELDGTRFYCKCLDGYVPSERPNRCQCMYFVLIMLYTGLKLLLEVCF